MHHENQQPQADLDQFVPRPGIRQASADGVTIHKQPQPPERD
jgi:hypothetical protein